MSSDDDGKTGRLRGWWSRRSTLTRATLIIIPLLIGGLLSFAYGDINGMSDFNDILMGKSQAEVLNYTVLSDYSGDHIVRGEIQNRYSSAMQIDYVWVKGFNRDGDLIGMGRAPVFRGSSRIDTLGSGERAYFETTDWAFKGGYGPEDVVFFGITARGNLLTPSGKVCT
ncbi:hypothetical protein DNK57_01385 [Methanothermobacter thermautotrophicus]|jgi:hypothetical protein|uniref:Uncharacterized protein n=1 Tax=Methanothermobacter thermautotrophicus TaxID=145262 RepID=A0A842YP37_METTF|nr:hypothetical protein [Methanothermobacter thermautotrophicus]MBE2899485.1 hypothetical protein [Methanothermobacter thermautotrophicus]